WTPGRGRRRRPPGPGTRRRRSGPSRRSGRWGRRRPGCRLLRSRRGRRDHGGGSPSPDPSAASRTTSCGPRVVGRCARRWGRDARRLARMERRHRVVVVGAGFGGLALVDELAEAPVDVVLVDANNFHTFQPLLYQVATAGLDSDDIAHPVRGIVARRRNVDVRMGKVVDVDLGARRVVFDDGPPLEYDQLVLAAGAVTATYGVPGIAEHAFGLKHLDDALALRAHVLRQFERVS